MLVQKVDLEQAILLLGFQSIGEVTPSKVVASFLKRGIEKEELVTAKNNLLINWMEYKDVEDLLIEAKNYCTACGGKGFNLSFFKVEFEKCRLKIITNEKTGKKIYSGCNGTGHKISECRACNGTGKIGEIPCDVCFDPKLKFSRGTYVYWKTKDPKKQGVKCFVCKGTGEVPKLMKQNTKIENIEFCKKCNKTGINTTIGSPVINLEVANMLKHKIAAK